MLRTLWLFSALFVAALVTGSCSSGEDEALAPTATLGPGPTTTAAPVEPPPDPAMIPADPADIDEEYVQAVVDALFAVDAKATEVFVNSGELDEEGIDYLEAIYTGDELDQQIDVWSQTLARGSETIRAGVVENDVTRMIGSAGDCLFFQVEVDYSDTTTREVPVSVNYLGLTPKRPSDDNDRRNPTAWMLFSNGFNVDGSQPENPCEGR